ncbi:hypothetical protein [Nonomuraea sp. B19D2]|uniref:DoxX family membrane protein n=1 Tax=Nonomuraea sp. B19D2 TaxID=3159561 RepID=UPI0032DA354D
MAGLSEFGGGLLLAAGLFAPLASAVVLGVMVNAIAVEWPKGLLQGFEFPLVLATAAGALAGTGPGRYALDEGRLWQRHGPEWAGASITLGLGAAAFTLLLRAF